MTFAIIATWTDAAALRRIARGAYQHYTAEMGREPAPMTADYAHHLRHDQVHVAVDDGGLALGFAVVIEKPEGGWLENIAVAPAVMGQGIGAALLRHVEDDLARAGAAALNLYTNQVMRQNIDWYRKNGYQETGRRREDGYQRVFFQKRI